MIELTPENTAQLMATLLELHAQIEAIKVALVSKGLLTEAELLDAQATAFARLDQPSLSALEWIRAQAPKNPLG